MAAEFSSAVLRNTNEENLRRFLQERGLRRDQLSSSGRLTSILDRGILSAQTLDSQGSSFSASYDSELNVAVYATCITRVQGIQRAVFNPADGIITIALEKEGDRAFMEVQAQPAEVERTYQEKLQQFRDSPLLSNPAFQSKVRERSLQECVSKNPDFLSELSTRAHQAAVFVLGLERRDSDRDDPSGCFDVVRQQILPTQIRAVVLSRQWRDANEVASLIASGAVRILFADAVEKDVIFCYKKGASPEQMKVRLEVPDFEPILAQLFGERRPLYIHTARL
jgi:hypothetical protein